MNGMNGMKKLLVVIVTALISLGTVKNAVAAAEGERAYSERERRLGEELQDAVRAVRQSDTVAMVQNKLNIIRDLIRRGASVNYQGAGDTTALMFETMNNVHLVEELLAAGANVNMQNVGGETPLIIALRLGKKEDVIKTLIDAPRADINIQDYDGTTALIWASSKGLDTIVNKLLAKGAQVNTINNKGKTALEMAIMKNRNSIVEKLILAGADVSLLPAGLLRRVTPEMRRIIEQAQEQRAKEGAAVGPVGGVRAGVGERLPAVRPRRPVAAEEAPPSYEEAVGYRECPVCTYHNPLEVQFCGMCGTPLR